MAFGSFVLTDFGQSILAKAHKNKGIHFSRMALGDGDIGTSSVFDVVQLKSEKLSLLIDAVSVTEKEAFVTVLLSNALVDTGFYLREMGLMAVDPDTSTEGVYAYNRDTSAGEYIQDKTSATTLREYLRVHCNTEGVQNITFQPSGNPLWITRDELESEVTNQITLQKGKPNGLATLDANGKLVQMPNYNDVGAAAKSTPVTVMLPASGWTGTDAPYSQTLTVQGAKPEPTRIDVCYSASATPVQREAWRAALITHGGQDTDKITLLADGDKPEIDIPMDVLVRGDLY